MPCAASLVPDARLRGGASAEAALPSERPILRGWAPRLLACAQQPSRGPRSLASCPSSLRRALRFRIPSACACSVLTKWSSRPCATPQQHLSSTFAM